MERHYKLKKIFSGEIDFLDTDFANQDIDFAIQEIDFARSLN